MLQHITLFNFEAPYQIVLQETLFNNKNILMNIAKSVFPYKRDTFYYGNIGFCRCSYNCRRILVRNVSVYRDKGLFKISKFDKDFQFGDGITAIYSKIVKFFTTIRIVRRIRAYIETDIVRKDLHLLLREKFIKTAGMGLDFKNDCLDLG